MTKKLFIVFALLIIILVIVNYVSKLLKAPAPITRRSSPTEPGGLTLEDRNLLTPSTSAVSIENVENSIFKLINEERSKRGLSTLVRSPILDKWAKQYATSKFLKDVLVSSDLCYLLINSWHLSYRGGVPQLTPNTAKEQVNYCLEQSKFRDIMLRPEARTVGIGAAIIEDKIYFTEVFDILNAIGGDGEPIRLFENPEAKNPSWKQLKEFLKKDNTDKYIYKPGLFVCADFAEMLHNNAEKAGIKAGYVHINFRDGSGHALNAFSVESKIVFIDEVRSLSSDLINSADKVAYIEKGNKYGVIELDTAKDFTYEYFEQYAKQLNKHLKEREAYNEKCKLHNEEREKYNRAVYRYHKLKTPAEYTRLKKWNESLNERNKELVKWDNKLKSEQKDLGIAEKYWNPAEFLVEVTDPTVINVYIHW